MPSFVTTSNNYSILPNQKSANKNLSNYKEWQSYTNIKQSCEVFLLLIQNHKDLIAPFHLNQGKNKGAE